MTWRSIACSSQVHWNTAASKIEVGVSALYSSSFAGPRPSKLRSMRPYRDGSSRCQLSEISGQKVFGIFSRSRGFVVDRGSNEFDAHGADLAGRRFDAAF